MSKVLTPERQMGDIEALVLANRSLRAKVAQLEQERNKAQGYLSELEPRYAEVVHDRAHIRFERDQARERIDQLEAQLAGARTALEPLAETWGSVPEWMREAARKKGNLTVDGVSITSCPAIYFDAASKAFAALAPEAPKAEEPKRCGWCGGTRVLCFGGPQLECGHCATKATNA